MKDKIKEHLEEIDNLLEWNIESFSLEQSFFMNESTHSDLLHMKTFVIKIREILNTVESEMN